MQRIAEESYRTKRQNRIWSLFDKCKAIHKGKKIPYGTLIY